MANGTTRSSGLYGITKEGVSVPAHIEDLSADLYREAFYAGWQRFALTYHDEDPKAPPQTTTPKSPGKKKSQKRAPQKKDGPLHALIKKGSLPDKTKLLHKRNLDTGYGELEARYRKVFEEAYVLGWEESALQYVRDFRKNGK